jgi:hypothetical protein
MSNTDIDDIFDDLIDDEEQEESDGSSLALDGTNGPSQIRTAVMIKNDMVALISLKLTPSGGLLVRVDPRQSMPAIKTYEDSDKAVHWYRRSLRTSQENGWNVVYAGEPLWG